jgi:carbon monoxide dehydrogenase subunit G
MKVRESFVIEQTPARVWEFLENVPAVARCVPGVESVEVLDDEQSRVRMTQAVGPMSATFDLKMRITERVEGDRMQFTAIGKAVKGAAGNVRTVNTVMLAQERDGTKVSLESDVAMGGVLGTVGQKVIARQAAGITQEFATALQCAMNGEAAAPPATTKTVPGAPRTASQPTGAAPLPWWRDARVTGLAGLSAGLGVAVLVAVRTGRR